MGKYINPKNFTKEEWLLANKVHMSHSAPKWSDIPADCHAVCLVNNGPFTAAGICDTPSELDAFTLPDDHRPKIWFTVKKEDLQEVCQDL